MDDVIVVGAGPAGNNAALGLASKGYAVKVIDWRQNIGDKLCTGIVGRECTQGFPIDPSLVHRQVRGAQVLAPSEASIRFETAEPQAQVIDRVAYVASFADQARTAGASYLLGQRAIKIIPEQRQVTVITEGGHHRARAVVLSAGFGSPLTRQVGLGSVPDHVTATQAVVSTKNITGDVEIYLGNEVAPGFFAWLVPTALELALVGLMARRNTQTYLARFIQRLQREGKIGEIIKDATCWGIPLRPLNQTFQNRLLVVGDAAGQVKPTTGGGIYYSLLASEIAAEVLAGALDADDLSAATLSQYQIRWRTLLSQEMEIGYSARRLYELLSDRQISSLVQKAATNGLRSQLVNSYELSFDWHSRMIAKVMEHPVIGRALWLINPILAHFAHHHGGTLSLPQAYNNLTNPMPKTLK